jgi:hypothetical protein
MDHLKKNLDNTLRMRRYDELYHIIGNRNIVNCIRLQRPIGNRNIVNCIRLQRPRRFGHVYRMNSEKLVHGND